MVFIFFAIKNPPYKNKCITLLYYLLIFAKECNFIEYFNLFKGVIHNKLKILKDAPNE